MKGLSKEEAGRLLSTLGYNVVEEKKERAGWAFIKVVGGEPMFFLLLGAAGLYMLLGDYKEGLVLSLAMVLIIAITFFQQQKSSRALEVLKKLAAPRARVLRDGLPQQIDGKEVVPGDWLLLSPGDRVTGDGVLQESSALYVDESLLSGESAPIHKSLEGDKLVFSGSLVLSGKGVLVVSNTGSRTRLGKIGSSLQSILPRKTPLQIASSRLTKKLFWIGFFISLLVFIAYYFSRGHFIEALLTGLSASMAILPEEFPVVLTVFFAIGAWRLVQNNVLTRNPSAIESLGEATVLCVDKTGTITENKMELSLLYNGRAQLERPYLGTRDTSFDSLLQTACLASENHSSDPMDLAIFRLCKGWGGHLEMPLVREYPLQDNFLAVTRVLRSGNSLVVAIKGAPETIFSLCGFSEQESVKHHRALSEMASNGYRVLGVAVASVNSGGVPEHPSGFSFSFLGLLGFEDPVRTGIKDAVVSCRRAGLTLVMVTGDHPATAKHVAEKIGLGERSIVCGEDMEKNDSASLARLVKEAPVFARILPEQKLRLIRAFHQNGEVVAMLGDGVNDAPALKAADIGVAMGKRGTDVAREAADLVLLDDNFFSVIRSIYIGRRIYDNLQKALVYILTIHVPIVGLVLVPAFWPTVPQLMLPVTVVFLELIIDPVCSVAFESQPAEPGIMSRPPRKKGSVFFSGAVFFNSLVSGLFLLGVVLLVFLFSIYFGYSERVSRGGAFISLVLGNLLLISSLLSFSQPFYSSFLKNRVAGRFLLLACLLLGGVFALSPLRNLFLVGAPDWKMGCLIGFFLFAYLVFLERRKLSRNKKSRAEL